MKIMLMGDTHGSVYSVSQKIQRARENGDISRLIILGDVGVWWGYQGVKFLDDINEAARDNNVQIFCIGGNHENWDLWNSIIEMSRRSGAMSKGWAYARTNVLLAPKVHKFVWGGKQFVVAGGAVSIDKDYRVEYERKKGTPIWSPGEQLTDAEVSLIDSWRVKADYLLTHDCSNRTPFRDRLKPDLDSQIHRQRIDRVLAATVPRKHFHGHMHTRYEWDNRISGDLYASTYGLECNDDYWSWGVLDTDKDTFVFRDGDYSDAAKEMTEEELVSLMDLDNE
jgi:predicted phosphodiesterase